MLTSNVQHDCLFSNGSNFCLTAEVYRTNYGDIQQKPVQQRPVQQQPIQQVGAVGRCPSAPQATGVACAQYIPKGSRETSCYFGRTQCNCALVDNPSVTETWNCRLNQDDTYAVPQPDLVQQPKPEPQPQPVVSRPVTVVPPPVTNVDAVIQNQVSEAPPIPINQGNILPNFINAPGCPMAKPSDGMSCEWGQSCAYYNESAAGVRTSAETCNCDGSCQFKCRKNLMPVFGSF